MGKVLSVNEKDMNFLENIDVELERAIKFLEDEYSSLHTGRANTALVEDIQVESYGSKDPLKSVASISITEPRLINIQPWDKSVLAEIEKAVRESGLNLSPVNTGELVRVTLPELTEERRKQFVKVAKDKAEEAKVSIRGKRHDILDKIKKAKSSGELSEDIASSQEKGLQNKIDEYNKKIEDISARKEKDLLEG